MPPCYLRIVLALLYVVLQGLNCFFAFALGWKKDPMEKYKEKSGVPCKTSPSMQQKQIVS